RTARRAMTARELRPDGAIVEAVIAAEQQCGDRGAGAERPSPIVRNLESSICGRADLTRHVRSAQRNLGVWLTVGGADAERARRRVAVSELALEHDAG